MTGNAESNRCTSQSEDGRRCHGDVDHPGTHWAGASRIWSDTETLARPVTAEEIADREAADRQAAIEEVGDRLPGLMYERDRLLSAHIEPTGVLLPARLDLSGAVDHKPTCMGLPVIWSDAEHWGLVVTLPEPRT